MSLKSLTLPLVVFAGALGQPVVADDEGQTTEQRPAAPAAMSSIGPLSFEYQDAGADDAVDLAALGADEWRVKFQPYIWIPAKIDVDSTVAGATVDLDLTFGDVLDNFDEIFALSGRVEAWKGDWAIIFDGFYVRIEGDFEVDPFGPGPIEDLNVEVEQSLVDLNLGWRIIDKPVGDKDIRLRVDLFGGMRYQYLKQEIDLSVGPTLGTSKDWVEIMIGGRATWQLNENWAFGVRGDASGFGIGSATDLTWNVYAGFDYAKSSKLDFIFGYRILDIDYSNGTGIEEFGLDGTMHGPYIAATFRF